MSIKNICESVSASLSKNNMIFVHVLQCMEFMQYNLMQPAFDSHNSYIKLACKNVTLQLLEISL